MTYTPAGERDMKGRGHFPSEPAGVTFTVRPVFDIDDYDDGYRQACRDRRGEEWYAFAAGCVLGGGCVLVAVLVLVR